VPRARTRYACLDHFREDTQVYGFVAGSGLAKSCEDVVVSQLIELQQGAMEYAQRDGRVAEAECFYAEQNARVVQRRKTARDCPRGNTLL
jgi:erythromycin esterase-like protein